MVLAWSTEATVKSRDHADEPRCSGHVALADPRARSLLSPLYSHQYGDDPQSLILT